MNIMRYIQSSAKFFLFASLFFVVTANAQQGFLDPTFGSQSKVIQHLGFDDSADGILVQPDKKIIVGISTHSQGDTNKVTLVRYLENGTLDPSFGQGGKSFFPLEPGHDECEDLLLQPDGRIVLIGSNLKTSNNDYESDFFVARFLPNGQLDTTFGAGKGYVMTHHDYRDYAVTGLLRPDGKIVLLGNSATPSPNIILAQFLPDGSKDLTFGNQGVKVLNLGSKEVVRSMALQGDGKIILTGFRYHILSDDDVWLARLMPNGALDPTFGLGGTTVYTQPENQRAWDCKLAPNGDIIVAGHNWQQGKEDFLALRFKPNGVLDTLFGQKGRVLVSFNEQGFESAGNVLIQPDGKIILIGDTYSAQYQTEFSLVRLTQGGTIDTTFGNQGKIVSTLGLYTDYPICATLAPDGKIVVGGYTALNNEIFNVPYDAVIARFLGEKMVSVNEPTTVFINPLVYPNPISTSFDFAYELSQNDCLSLHLINPNGQTVQILFSETFRTSGKHVEHLNVEYNLPSGQYLLHLQGKTFQWFTHLYVIKN